MSDVHPKCDSTHSRELHSQAHNPTPSSHRCPSPTPLLIHPASPLSSPSPYLFSCLRPPPPPTSSLAFHPLPLFSSILGSRPRFTGADGADESQQQVREPVVRVLVLATRVCVCAISCTDGAGQGLSCKRDRGSPIPSHLAVPPPLPLCLQACCKISRALHRKPKVKSPTHKTQRRKPQAQRLKHETQIPMPPTGKLARTFQEQHCRVLVCCLAKDGLRSGAPTPSCSRNPSPANPTLAKRTTPAMTVACEHAYMKERATSVQGVRCSCPASLACCVCSLGVSGLACAVAAFTSSCRRLLALCFVAVAQRSLCVLYAARGAPAVEGASRDGVVKLVRGAQARAGQ